MSIAFVHIAHVIIGRRHSGGVWALPTAVGTTYQYPSSSLSNQISPKFNEESNKTNL